MSFSINIINAEDDTYIESPWVYRLDGNTITIISYTGSDEVCEVPWTLGGKEIKRIESIQNDKVRKIIIPNNDVELSSDISHNYEIVYYNLNGELLAGEENESNEEESGSTFFDFIGETKDSKEENSEVSNKTDENTNTVNTNTDTNTTTVNNKNTNNTKKQNNNKQITEKPFNEREDNPFDDEQTNNKSDSVDLNNNPLSANNTSKSKFPYFSIICFAGVILIVYFAFKKYKDIISNPSSSRNFKRLKRKIMNKFR